MTWQVHSAWLERQFDGTDAMDLDSVLGGNTVNLGIVTESVINPDTVNLYSTLTPVATGTAWTGPVALANIACGLDVSNDLQFDADDPAVIAVDGGGGFTNGRSLVLFDNTSSFIIASHIEGASFGNSNGTITITFAATGVWVLSI